MVRPLRAPSPGGAPLRTAAAPRRRAPTLVGALHFLLILIGATSLVAANWNARRHRELAELRGVRDRLEGVRAELVHRVEVERGWYDGVEADPRVRRHLLEHLLGPGEDAGVPLSVWLARDPSEAIQ